ncbi:MAG: hypothetical protein VB949_01915 [Pseudomonadales bacterium]|jgi:hypothetical protein
MKLRIRANSVRLRLSDDEVVQISRGESIIEETPFPGGLLVYQLSVGGEEISARFSATQGIEISLPEDQASGWAARGGVALSRRVNVGGDGGTLMVLIEKDLKADKDS